MRRLVSALALLLTFAASSALADGGFSGFAALSGTSTVPTGSLIDFNAVAAGGINWATVPQNDATSTQLASSVASSIFNTTNDWLYNLGWNIQNGSGLINSAKPGIGIQIESDFNRGGGVEGSEFHILYVAAGGGSSTRMFTTNCQFSSNTCSTTVEGSPVTIDTGDGNATELAQFNAGTSNPRFQIVTNSTGAQQQIEFTNQATSNANWGISVVSGGGGDGQLWFSGPNLSGKTEMAFATDFTVLLGKNNSGTGGSGATVDVQNADSGGITLFRVRAGVSQSTNPVASFGGAVFLSKIAATAAAPGASGGNVELICGTGAGTAKLIAYAGTSTTPVTIIDNIGAGVTGC